jgi:hypothetical protein
MGAAVIHDQLRFRVWVGGELVREDWLPGATLGAGVDLARVHAGLATEAEAKDTPWLVEVYDPAAPVDEGYMRFGSDASQMVCPVAVVLIGSDDVT